MRWRQPPTVAHVTDDRDRDDLEALARRVRDRRRRELRWRVEETLRPCVAVLAAHLAMIAGFVVVGFTVSRIMKVDGELHRFLILIGLVAAVGGVLVFTILVRMVDDDDLGPLQVMALIAIIATGGGLGMMVPLERDRTLIRAGPTATAVVIEVSQPRTPLPLFGDPYQAYDLRLTDGDRREFIVAGAVGEFDQGDRVEVKVDPEGILDPLLPRDAEPLRTMLVVVAAIPVTLSVGTVILLFIGIWRSR